MFLHIFPLSNLCFFISSLFPIYVSSYLPSFRSIFLRSPLSFHSSFLPFFSSFVLPFFRVSFCFSFRYSSFLLFVFCYRSSSAYETYSHCWPPSTKVLTTHVT